MVMLLWRLEYQRDGINLGNLCVYLPIRIIPFLGDGRALHRGSVQSCMLYGSETWPVKKENELALQQAEIRMIRWMCGVKATDRFCERETRMDETIIVLQ